jgi:isopentenyl-diphosphate Delta-isomerase
MLKKMKKTKLFIKNRKNQKIAIIIEKPKNPIGLAFIMHGSGGFKEQPHIQTFTKACLKNKYTTIRFDTTNSFGESDGNYENTTITNYYQDLEDVIKWTKNKKFYQEPFILFEHSLGGISTVLYAQKYPLKIKALAPISTVISGRLLIKNKDKKEFQRWKKTGWYLKPSTSKPGTVKKLRYSFINDAFKYDILNKIEKIKIPVLLIVGDKDIGTPPREQKILFNKLKTNKELHIIKNAPHTFRDKKDLDKIYKIIDKWLKNKINNLHIEVDKNDKRIGLRPRKDFLNGKYIHRSSHLLLFNKKNELLIYKRKANKKWYPNLYSMSVDETLENESYEECMERGIREELGVTLNFKKLFKFKLFDPGINKEFLMIFKATTDRKINVTKKESANQKWISLKELKKDFHTNPSKYTPQLKKCLKIYFQKFKK